VRLWDILHCTLFGLAKKHGCKQDYLQKNLSKCLLRVIFITRTVTCKLLCTWRGAPFRLAYFRRSQSQERSIFPTRYRIEVVATMSLKVRTLCLALIIQASILRATVAQISNPPVFLNELNYSDDGTKQEEYVCKVRATISEGHIGRFPCMYI